MKIRVRNILLCGMTLCVIPRIACGVESDPTTIMEVIDLMRAGAVMPSRGRLSVLSRSERRIDGSPSVLGVAAKTDVVNYSVVVDGDRLDVTREAQIADKDPFIIRTFFDGEKYYSYSQGQGSRLLYAESDRAKSLGSGWRSYYESTFPTGVPGVSLDDLLERNSGNLSLKPETETVDGFPCRVIEGNTEWGYYRLWLDTQHGYKVRKAHLHKDADHLDEEGKPLSYLPSNPEERVYQVPRVKYDLFLDGVDIETVGGYYIEVGRHISSTTTFENGSKILFDSTVSVDSIDPNPDFQSLDVFNTDFIPNGVKVYFYGSGGISYEWRNGRVVPDLPADLEDAFDGTIEMIVSDTPKVTQNVEPAGTAYRPTGSVAVRAPHRTYSDRAILVFACVVCVAVLVVIGIILLRWTGRSS